MEVDVGGGGGGGQIEKRLTWALNLAAFLHIIVSPYTKVIPLMFVCLFVGKGVVVFQLYPVLGGGELQLAGDPRHPLSRVSVQCS